MNIHVYISGPMTGLPDHNFPAFEAAAADLLARGYKVHNPASTGVVPGWVWEDYMREDIRHLVDCAAVVVLPGWRQSRGAKIEVALAQDLGMPILEYPSLARVEETVCQEADRLVSHDRQSTYGHPIEDFTRTGKLWAAILGLPEVTPEQVALCMVGVKISRQCHKPKRDNLVDGCGYLKCLDMVIEEQARRGESQLRPEGVVLVGRTTPPPRPSA